MQNWKEIEEKVSWLRNACDYAINKNAEDLTKPINFNNMESNNESEMLIQKVEHFAARMKYRISQMSQKGKEGYNDLTIEQIREKLIKSRNFDEVFEDVDLANWCMIHWLKK